MSSKWNEPRGASTYGGITMAKALDGSTGEGYGNNHRGSDAGREGTESLPGESERPCYKVLDDWLELSDGSKLKPGVWFFGIKWKDNAEPTFTQQWICSPLHVDAITFDDQSNNFGRLLRFKPTVGAWREWSMPMELLAGSGEELRAILLSMGVVIDPNARQLFAQYLLAQTPKTKMYCVTRVGWCGDSFVLPDVVIGPNAAKVIFQSAERTHDEYTQKGTLLGWQTDIAARAIGNRLLALGLSAGFAGPLLAKCNAEGGGLHFVGDSSTGKTTAVEAACSIWGGPNFKRSWNSTANGQEGIAATLNDGLLALDEIREADPRDVGKIVYMLGNGVGKQRANRTGTARSVIRFCCMVLSSGEHTIKTTMAEAGHRINAGQAVRLLDIPAAQTFGVWNHLHGLPSGRAFSDALKRAVATHYGHAGRDFLEKLTRDKRDFCDWLEQIKALPEFIADGGEGQAQRAAGRFALLALAGELATEYGITGWPKGEATKAATEGFKLWVSTRGERNDEQRKILEQVAGFIERHGDSRFSNENDTRDFVVRDRAGWYRDTGEGREYLFTAEGMRDCLRGFDFERALDALQEAGALPKPGADGRRSSRQRIKSRGRELTRFYMIDPEKLDA